MFRYIAPNTEPEGEHGELAESIFEVAAEKEDGQALRRAMYGLLVEEEIA